MRRSYPRAATSVVDYLSTSNVSIDAILAADGLHLVATALNRMLLSQEEREIFKTFRHNQLYNWGSRGVQCWARPPLPWKHGPTIRKGLLKTTVQGMTGRVQLDEQGSRSGYSLDVMQLEYRTPLRRVGSWTRESGVATNLTRPNSTREHLDANRTRLVTTIKAGGKIGVKDIDENNRMLLIDLGCKSQLPLSTQSTVQISKHDLAFDLI
ncbi:glutamate receptor subunit protein glur2 [Plakobranchus ocellatus]|uniref:Glutamate receptor subunit protein glur2 n=1 Tax=Plakobranchus ocellatus TaxID=259542 RepID=A0AAV3Y8W1_9GAST|nr:glutamate receptor subunit protein glur2 [Plakobranchus ocellatus]